MKLPALLIAIFVAAGVLAAPPIAAHLTHGLGLSLGIALRFILVGIVLLKLRQAHLVWGASLLAWFSLAAAAAQIERIAILPNQVIKLAARGQLQLLQPLRLLGILPTDPFRLP